MPLLFSLGLHTSLKAISDRLLITEKIFAFLDDIHLVCRPNRVAAVHEIVHQELQRHTNIDIHVGRRRFGIAVARTAAVRVQDPRLEGRPGDPSFRARHEGVGRAVGRDECAAKFLEKKTEFHNGTARAGFASRPGAALKVARRRTLNW